MSANHRPSYRALVAALRAEFNGLQLEALNIGMREYRYNHNSLGVLAQAVHDAHDINYDTTVEDGERMNDTTGFAALPWDHAVPGVDEFKLPAAPPRDDDSCCSATWAGSYEDSQPWLCSRSQGHSGTHRAGNGTETVAEWRDQDATKAATR